MMTFPCEFVVKVMGKNTDDFVVSVLQVMRKHFPEFGDCHLKQQTSKESKYLSLSLTVHAKSKAQLDDLYSELNKNPEVLMTL